MTWHLADLDHVSLNTLIRRPRAGVQIGEATEVEIQALSGEFTKGSPDNGTIDGWFPIALRIGEQLTIRLVGDLRSEKIVWITSAVQRFDLQRILIETSSGSFYGLGNRAVVSAPRHVLHIAAALWREAPRAAALLDIPRVWY